MRIASRATGMLGIAVTALVLTGCGGGSEERGSGFSSDETTPPDATFAEPTVPKGAPQPPKGASPILREIYRQFTPPKPDPRVKASGKAIAAGKRACAGRTPVEVERRYYPIAVQKGMLDPNSSQGKTIAEVGKYAKHASTDPSFAAGQLAAGAYQATLPSRIAPFGYQGCVYSLARELEKALAPGG